jgi:hypothetical protein
VAKKGWRGAVWIRDWKLGNGGNLLLSNVIRRGSIVERGSSFLMFFISNLWSLAEE